MSPGRARLLLAVVTMVAIVGVAVARSTSAEQASVAAVTGPPETLPVLGGAAPPVTSQQWLNTEPLSAADLAGKVVLYDFWTFGCFNCRNTLGLPFLAGPLVLGAVPGLPARLVRSTRWSTPFAAAVLCGLGVLLLTGTTSTVLGPVDRWLTG